MPFINLAFGLVKIEGMLLCFDTMYESDRQTDRRTYECSDKNEIYERAMVTLVYRARRNTNCEL